MSSLTLSAALSPASPGHLSAPRSHDGQPLDTRALLAGRKAVTLVHNGIAYRLQATRMGKLILTK